MNTAAFNIRPTNASDESFVYSSWLKSYRNSDFAKPIVTSFFYKLHHKVLERILARPTTQVLVACDPTAPDVVYGYLVAENVGGSTPVIHYAYVKAAFRRNGIAKALFSAWEGAAARLILYSHKTNEGTRAIAKATPDSQTLLYAPYFI